MARQSLGLKNLRSYRLGYAKAALKGGLGTPLATRLALKPRFKRRLLEPMEPGGLQRGYAEEASSNSKT